MFFTDSHEWVKVQGDIARVGITSVASKELETIVNICFPKIDLKVSKGDEILILESTKAASDSYAPISGTIVAVNQDIVKQPSLIHSDPQGSCWLYEMRIENHDELEELMSESHYLASLNASV